MECLHRKLRRVVWWTVQGSNPRHSQCKCDALPAELTVLKKCVYFFRVNPFRYYIICFYFLKVFTLKNCVQFFSADERSRTSTLFRALPPQGSVYTISPHPRKSHFIIPEAELKVFTLKNIAIFFSARGGDSNSQVFRHTHLKRTCPP